MCHGAFADVWKGRHRGQEVAAKVLKVYKKDDLERVRRVGDSCRSRRVIPINNRLRLIEVLQEGCGMEDPPSSKRAAPVRRNDVRESGRDGIRVDGEREYQPVREGVSQRRSVGTCVFFVQHPRLHPLMTIAWLRSSETPPGG